MPLTEIKRTDEQIWRQRWTDNEFRAGNIDFEASILIPQDCYGAQSKNKKKYNWGFGWLIEE